MEGASPLLSFGVISQRLAAAIQGRVDSSHTRGGPSLEARASAFLRWLATAQRWKLSLQQPVQIAKQLSARKERTGLTCCVCWKFQYHESFWLADYLLSQ